VLCEPRTSYHISQSPKLEVGLWCGSGCGFCGGVLGLQREVKVRAASERGLSPDSAPLLLYQPPADCQTHSAARVFVAMRLLEHAEDSFSLDGIEPDAVVGYGELPVAAGAYRRNANLGTTLSGILDGVGQQVLKDEHQCHGVCPHRRQAV